jgi:methylenetetrahydrofolate--tRNA-(uracil-5-)-methyltransferase
MDVTVVGGGFAGVECAWQLARRGHTARLVEMRPRVRTPAHQGEGLAEMVCSNSFRSDNPLNAVGLLKREMEALDSLVMACARQARVPAGDALAVDRAAFSERVTAAIAASARIEIAREEIGAIPPEGLVVLATGPLTSGALARSIRERLGTDALYFYDSMAPIVTVDSLDQSQIYPASRYGKGDGDDYLNCPMTRAQYEQFVAELLAGETVPVHDFEKGVYFEGCLPIEVMAERGIETLRHGPLKPMGLEDPRTGKRPHAVVQLRQDDLAREHFNLVGFQTKLKVGEQKRIFRQIPGLENASFVRFGMLHRNTYIHSPAHLDRFFRLRDEPRIFFAGQITGVEGYTESSATGLIAGINLARMLDGLEPVVPPPTTMLGALYRYLREADPAHFQPMNANFGLLDDLGERVRDKRRKRELFAARALGDLQAWRAEHDMSAAAP